MIYFLNKFKGIFDDEYSQQELSDGLKILEWIQNQSWSNGKVSYLKFFQFYF